MASTADRIVILARQKQSIFHTQDLARLWGIENLNTLYSLLRRYHSKRILFRIYKGLYSLLPVDQLDALIVGAKALHSFAYVSTETVLVEAGIIAQADYHYTFVSAHSRRFQIGNRSFISRQLKDEYLYNSAGISEKNGLLIASLERAVADLLYFNPKVYLDGVDRLDFAKVRDIQKEVGYPLTPL